MNLQVRQENEVGVTEAAFDRQDGNAVFHSYRSLMKLTGRDGSEGRVMLQRGISGKGKGIRKGLVTHQVMGTDVS